MLSWSARGNSSKHCRHSLGATRKNKGNYKLCRTRREHGKKSSGSRKKLRKLQRHPRTRDSMTLHLSKRGASISSEGRCPVWSTSSRPMRGMLIRHLARGANSQLPTNSCRKLRVVRTKQIVRGSRRNSCRIATPLTTSLARVTHAGAAVCM